MSSFAASRARGRMVYLQFRTRRDAVRERSLVARRLAECAPTEPHTTSGSVRERSPAAHDFRKCAQTKGAGCCVGTRRPVRRIVMRRVLCRRPKAGAEDCHAPGAVSAPEGRCGGLSCAGCCVGARRPVRRIVMRRVLCRRPKAGAEDCHAPGAVSAPEGRCGGLSCAGCCVGTRRRNKNVRARMPAAGRWASEAPNKKAGVAQW